MPTTNDLLNALFFGMEKYNQEELSYRSAGYDAYLENEQRIDRRLKATGLRPREQSFVPMPGWMWANLPQFKREQYVSSEHEALLPREEGGKVPRGYILDAGEAHAFTHEALMASAIETSPTGVTTTYPEEKWAKYTLQRLGQHEQFFLEDRPIERGQILPGTKSRAPEQYQTMQGFYVMGGDPFHGAGFIERTLGIGNTASYYVSGEGLKPVPAGTTYQPGQNLVLAQGTQGRQNPRWVQTLLRTEPLPAQGELESGFRAVVGRSASVEDIAVKASEAGTKSMLMAEDLTRAADVYGRRGYEFVAALKDIGGAAYEQFRTERLLDPAERTKVALELGYQSVGAMPKTYSELAGAQRQRFSGMLGGMATTLRMPMVLHESRVGQYPVSGTPTPVEGQPGLVNAMLEFKGLAGEWGKALTIEYDPRRGFLNPTEWERLQEMRPELTGQALEYGRPIQSAYRSIISASLASTGWAEAPELSVSAAEIRPELQRGLIAAEYAARAATGITDPTTMPPERVMAQQFFQHTSELQSL